MFKPQLHAELSESVTGMARMPAVNSDGEMLHLIEAAKGIGQFRVTLPDVVAWSPRAAAIHGMDDTRELPLQEAIRQYVPDDRKMVVETITQALERRSGFRYVARLKTPDGTLRTIDCIGDVVLDGERVTGAFGALRDVSVKVEKEALAIGRARLIRSLVNEMPVPVAVLDRALRVVACSREWALSHGVTRGKALGRALTDLAEVPSDITAAIIAALGGKTVHATLPLYTSTSEHGVVRECAVIPWQCGSERADGVLMVWGVGERAYASLEIADRASGAGTRGLMRLLEAM